MDVSIGGHQIRLDNGGVDTTALHSNRLVVVVARDHVEVKESAIVVCGNLGDLELQQIY